MSIFDKIAELMYRDQVDPAKADANDLEEQRLVRAQLVRAVQQAEKEVAERPDSDLSRAGLAAARKLLADFDNMF